MKILKPLITNADIDAGKLSYSIDETKLGLGDLVSSVTKAVGIRECDKCEERKEILNRAKELGFIQTIRQLKDTL